MSAKIEFGKPFAVELEGAPPIELLWIPPGKTIIGVAAESRDEGEFEARFGFGFWLGKYPITRAQWSALTKTESAEIDDRPVTGVSWNAALDYCRQLTHRCSDSLPASYAFSLPTEAQWEYACRAGTTTKYHSGDTLQDLERVAWVGRNSGGRIHKVGMKLPNAWGLYDMHGNVGEWCFDEYINYPKGAVCEYENTFAPSVSLTKVVRSAHAMHPPDGVFRSATRLEGCLEGPSWDWIGFRLAARLQKIQKKVLPPSPIIRSASLGQLEVEGFGTLRDGMLFPGGADTWHRRERDGARSANTICIEDVAKLTSRGAKVVIFATGIESSFGVPRDVVDFVWSNGHYFQDDPTPRAIAAYNTLARRGEPVGALVCTN